MLVLRDCKTAGLS